MVSVEFKNISQVGSETSVPAEEMIKNMGFVEVGSDSRLLRVAKREVAWQYSTLSTKGITPDDAYEDLCRDGYDNNGRSITIVGVLGGDDADLVLAGTVRLVVGRGNAHDDLPSLDAMNLFDISEWPHRERKISDDETGELGRFVIPSQFRTPEMDIAGVTNHITSGLFNKALSSGRERAGIKSLYAIMPDYVVSRVTRSGIGVEVVEGAYPKQDDNSARQKFEKYDTYWQRMKPQLYEFVLP